MIELKNVAVENLSYAINDLQYLINEFDIHSLQDLEDLINNRPDINFSKIQGVLERVKEDILKYNLKGKEPKIYLMHQYQDATLNYTDTLNKVDCLLLSSPTAESIYTYCDIKNMPISDIINYLRLTTLQGDNYLTANTRKIGDRACHKLQDGIKMYHEQVERQSKLTNIRNQNLFMYQWYAKKEIVEKLYEPIITYLVENHKELVWGKLSDSQKRLYLSSLIKDNRLERMLRKRIINIVTGYTTLPEVKAMERHDDFHILNRFSR